MIDILTGEGHTALHIFRVVTWVLLLGGAAWKTGAAMANRWRPWPQVVGYIMLLGAADRFIVYALYFGDLWSLPGYLIDTAILMAIALIAYRSTMAANMVAQYPWLYARTSLLSWREAPAEAPQPPEKRP